jgi:hypothetical protein
MTREASSRVLTAEPLTAVVLQPMRALAARQTVRHLAAPDRDPWDLPGGPLSVAFGATLYPLVPVQGAPQDRYAHRKALALDTTGTVSAARFVGRCVVVAVVVPETLSIDFIKVVQNSPGQRRVDGVTRFAPVPPPAEPRPTPVAVPASATAAAVFTD